MWELEDAPPRDFQAACSRVDELWASTRFLERAFAAAGRPVYYIPPFLPARPLRERPITDLFTVLTVSDAASNLRRKNPLGSLQAFQAAFRPDDRVELVVKTRRTNIDPEFWQRFRKLCEGWPVRIIESDLPRAEYQALLYSADCLLSMHRSEGFGIPIAEAMRAGIPTVATGYGGNMDWQTLENSVVVPFSMVELEHADGPYAAGAHWAEPDTEAAAEGLRRLYRDREWREALGAEAARTTETLLDPRRTLAAMQERISALETAC
jgi:glycosyltransferase involved in cell wall biosynthesis